MIYKLRDYQEIAEKDILNYFKSDSNVPSIVVQPCGAGKSLLIAISASLTDKPVLVIQPSKELLEQNYDKFINIGGEAYLYSSSVGKKEKGHTTYGTPLSLKGGVDLFNDVEIVIIDECHEGCKRGGVIDKLIKKIKPKKVLGLTATPCILDNDTSFSTKLTMLPNTYKSIFKKIIHVTQVDHLVENNYWAKLEYMVGEFDSSQLRKNKSGTDFTEESIIKSYETNNTKSKIVNTFKKMLKNGVKHTLIFVPSVKEANSLADNELKGLVKVISAKTPKKDRVKILKDFKSGVLKGVINVDVLTTGFDFPELDGIICARSTNSFQIFYQMFGRGVRIHDSKNHCLIVDLGGMIQKFGKLEDIKIEWIDGVGYQIFSSGDYLVTGYDLSLGAITKDEYLKALKSKVKSSIKIEGNLKTFWFGKHKGLDLKKVPINYINWILKNEDFDWYFNKEVKEEDINNFKIILENLIKDERERQIS